MVSKSCLLLLVILAVAIVDRVSSSKVVFPDEVEEEKSTTE
jgi:hypothetical protein